MKLIQELISKPGFQTESLENPGLLRQVGEIKASLYYVGYWGVGVNKPKVVGPFKDKKAAQQHIDVDMTERDRNTLDPSVMDQKEALAHFSSKEPSVFKRLSKKVFETIKRFDMKGKRCHECKKGKFEETGIQDDWDGVLHCSNCGLETKRHVDKLPK